MKRSRGFRPFELASYAHLSTVSKWLASLKMATVLMLMTYFAYHQHYREKALFGSLEYQVTERMLRALARHFSVAEGLRSGYADSDDCLETFSSLIFFEILKREKLITYNQLPLSGEITVDIPAKLLEYETINKIYTKHRKTLNLK